ncbi:MAG: hypothetical protein O3A51_08570 [Verrucomicrobia bacterium]|nr:hypothetical protein [Verrucomicrobiota bacterium]
MVRSKFAARGSKNVVRRPTEIPKCHIVARPVGRQSRFQKPVSIHVGDQRVAQQHHARRRRGDVRLVDFVLQLAVQRPVSRDGIGRDIGIARGELRDLFRGQGAPMDAHVINTAMERFASIAIGPDVSGSRTAGVERPGQRLRSHPFPVQENLDGLPVVGSGHVMPGAIAKLLLWHGHSEFRISP